MPSCAISLSPWRRRTSPWLWRAWTRRTCPCIFRLLPKELAADTFVEMDSDLQEALIAAFSDRELREVIDEMFLDDTVDIIEEMPANVVKRILKNVDADTRKSINEVLNYPEDSAGSIMTIEYVDLRPDMTVKEAFEHIRRTGVDKETIYTCYVISAVRKLLGLVSVKDLLLASYEDRIRDVMETNVISVATLRRPGGGRQPLRQIRLHGAAGGGRRKPPGRHRHRRRRHRGHAGGDDGGHREDGRHHPVRAQLFQDRHLRDLEAAHPLAAHPHGLGDLHRHDYLLV
jgi:CBS domain-containing protein